MSDIYPTLQIAQADIELQKFAETKDAQKYILDKLVNDNPPLIYMGWIGQGQTAWYSPARNEILTPRFRDFCKQYLLQYAKKVTWLKFYKKNHPGVKDNDISEKDMWQAILDDLNEYEYDDEYEYGEDTQKKYKPEEIRHAGIYRSTNNSEQGTIYFCGQPQNCLFYPDNDPHSPRRIFPIQDDFCYISSKRSIPMPADTPITTEESKKLHTFFKARQWAMDSDIASTIITGWLVSSLLAAFDIEDIGFRPQIWVTGIRSSGKTKLFRDMTRILGYYAVNKPWCGVEFENVTSTTIPGIKQDTSSCPGPIFFDEIDNDGTKNTQQRINCVLDILRAAATNYIPKITQGSPEGISQKYYFQNSFALGSTVAFLTRSTNRSRVIELPMFEDPSEEGKKIFEETDRLRKELCTPNFTSRFIARVIFNIPRILRTVKIIREALSPVVTVNRYAERLAIIFAGHFILHSDAEITEAELNDYISKTRTLEEEEDTDDPFAQVLSYLTQIVTRIGSESVTLGQIIAYLLDQTVINPDRAYVQTAEIYGLYIYRDKKTDNKYLQIDYANKNLVREFRAYPRSGAFWKDFSDGCRGTEPNKHGVIHKVMCVPGNWARKKRHILIPAALLPSHDSPNDEQDD